MHRPTAGRLRLASWNINSVRARLDLIDRFIKAYAPDVLCLQEIKVETAQFPGKWFVERGYRHQAVRGQRNHHGVATLSRIALGETESRDWCAKGDARHVSGMLPGGVALHNFYVPAGGDEPDPEVNPRFAHKLDFLDEMITWAGGIALPTIMLGDLNVAPLETDVWSHKQLLKVVSHTPVETERMARLRSVHGWIDAVRHFIPPQERLYSWWSYRARDWRASNRGRRLDHIWVSPALEPALIASEVVADARGWPRPSDHAPVILDLDLSAATGPL